MTTSTDTPRKRVTFEQAREWLDGKAWKLDGIDGVIRVEGKSPYTRVMHYPSAKGRRTGAYQAKRREYRDDWMSDITTSDSLVTAMEALGVRFEGYDDRRQSIITIPDP
jgi:hypothetical protein